MRDHRKLLISGKTVLTDLICRVLITVFTIFYRSYKRKQNR